MQRVIQVVDLVIHPVCGNRVLDQIVGADGKEVQVLGEQIGTERRSRHFHHGTHGHARVQRQPRPRQLDAALLDDAQHLTHFLNVGKHGHQQAHGTVLRGP